MAVTISYRVTIGVFATKNFGSSKLTYRDTRNYGIVLYEYANGVCIGCAILHICITTWWRHQMEPFSPLLTLCEGNPSVTSQRPVTRRFDIFFDLCCFYQSYQNKWVNKCIFFSRICFLETIAGVPGMVAAMVRHLDSLRKMRRDHGWIHTLLGGWKSGCTLSFGYKSR